ncbi:hypothetical protein CLV51_11058 [Chitinophaga niastensis]|uniref:DUF5977 domain-containing protein n=2 Tax=Chitinophaga niastensis TaxID=536980 RepID=A0A2P8H9D8_CHINA|nr:hypothetical protein CLV51_11058 [Chitinophaga niastensis]
MKKQFYPFFIFLQLLLPITAICQVDLPTGSASFNVPLFQYTDGNRLSSNISLDYTGGSGIKVDEIPTSTGLGWRLQAGGVIVRNTNGVPDDQIGGVYSGDRYSSGYLYPPYTNLLNPISPRGGFVPLIPYNWSSDYYKPDSSVMIDLEQDIFVFQYGGRTGSFIIASNGNILPLDNSKLKIEKLEKDMSADSIITRISGFVITDEVGIRYTFLAPETSKVISYERGAASTTTFNQTLINLQYKINNYSVITSWYLTEIYDPLSSNKITFSYADYNLDYLIGYSGAYALNIVGGTGQATTQSIQQRFSGKRKRITGIAFPGGKTNVLFKYFDTDLVDLPGEKALKQMVVLRDSIETTGYQFNYNYFFKDTLRAFNYSFAANELQYPRLCLNSIQKSGLYSILEPPYVFSYFTKYGYASMPARTSGGRDHFGYFNNDVQGQDYSTTDLAWNSTRALTLNTHRFAAVGPPVIGALKEVQYPAGGKLQFDYENNTAAFGASTVLSGGIRVRRTTQIDMVDTTKKIINDYRYVNVDSSSSGWGYETPLLLDTSSNYLVLPPSSTPYKPVNMSYNTASSAKLVITDDKKIKAADIAELLGFNVFICIAVAVVQNLFTPPPATTIQTIPSYQELSDHPSKYNLLPHMYSRVEVYQGSTANNIGKTVYEFTSPTDFPISVPLQQAPFSANQRCLPWVYGMLKRKLELNKNNNPSFETINNYNASISRLNSNGVGSIRWKAKQVLMCPEGLYNGYNGSVLLINDSYLPLVGRTELLSVTNKKYDSTGNFTQTVTTFTNDNINYYPKKITTTNSIGDTIQQRNYYTADYNSANIIAFKVMNDANMINIPISQETWKLSSTGQQLLDASISDFRPLCSGDLKVTQNLTFQNASPLPSSIAGTFDGTTLNRLPSYIKLQQALSFDSSSGRPVHILNPNAPEIGYQWGYNNEYVVAVVKNAHAAHIEKGVVGNVTNGIMSAVNNQTQTATITLSQPGNIYLQLVAPPTGEARYCSYFLSKNLVLVKSGNLCNVVSTGQVPDIWNTYKIANPRSALFSNLPAGTYTITANNFQIISGQPNPSTSLNYAFSTEPTVNIPAGFFYQGFEDITNAATDNPYAGKKYNIGSYTVPFNIADSRSYKIDYRYLSAGNWNYVSKPYTNNMVLSDGVGIDEVRVYPVDATITTYTYLPLIGITSETDENGRTVFNEYDPLGRLCFVKDEHKNILKRICYNYAGQPENCGGQSYSNLAVSQTFTKQGCGQGFTPGTGVYTIPAGTYTADDFTAAYAMAMADILKNGQNYVNQNTACSCVGVDHAIIGGVCELGVREDFVVAVDGGANCKSAYWYRYSDGSHGPTYLGGYVTCP